MVKEVSSNHAKVSSHVDYVCGEQKKGFSFHHYYLNKLITKFTSDGSICSKIHFHRFLLECKIGNFQLILNRFVLLNMVH